VRSGDRDIGLEQHLENQLFKLVEIHGYVIRLAHANKVDRDEPRCHRDHFCSGFVRVICAIDGQGFRH
jgi:hypothetical protein